VNSEIDAGRIHASQRDRPAGVDNPNVMRIMVLMTDGQNCCGARGQPAQLDDNTKAVCDNLKAEGVTVFAVAFEAPASGAALMDYCASSPGHYFNTNGAGVSDTFRAIGRQINAQSLRLTL
jgi:Mg-chelatase subunit ChlD